jgi:hypothetical protein
VCVQFRPLIVLTISFALVRSTFGASTTWHYSATVKPAFQNDLGFAVPVGEKVNIDFTFDPSTPDTGFGPGNRQYQLSGGNTELSVSIGSHIATPIDKFNLRVLVAGCCASDDQYEFVDYSDGSEPIGINFPGYLEGAQISVFFRERFNPGPITSGAIPTDPPRPSDFASPGIFFYKNLSDLRHRLIFSAGYVPEPATWALGGPFFVLMVLYGIRRRIA